MNLERNVREFKKRRNSFHRYASFDYCFNYFRSFYESDKLDELASEDNIDRSCFRLGFYLASWGMFRGSSFLLGKSAKHFEDLIMTISSMDRKYWEIDVDNYEKNAESLLTCRDKVRDSIKDQENTPTKKLVTKIMLGVFGNVPALDSNFQKGTGFYNKFNKTLLERIRSLYSKHQKEIDGIKIPTIDFVTGDNTNRFYTKAKIIDMAGFIEGIKKGE
ncbi:hypothetical protein AKJ49_01615 [candidate division MSBL1 archaeon SCGC-AAA382A03]|uniref:Uncharacterized protein n=1 Tax=candidate division MSBL1 archaeon SCGC-AAA382A03 TaxID=1698278 RepID=A0A133VEI4_9EURY|nr:hypothetical protein AKJ49_01615 [candidate division MSBL1 archaeon SCGC-AAA382A03]